MSDSTANDLATHPSHHDPREIPRARMQPVSGAQQRRAAFRAVPTLQRELQKQRAKHEAVVKSFEAWTADHARDLERRVEAERAVIYAECQAVLDERLERFKASLRKENESLHGRYLGCESWSLDAVLAEDARLRDGSSAALSGFGGLG